MRRLFAHVRHACGRTLSQIPARPHSAGSGSDEVSKMRSLASTMSYLELLKFASPEAVVVISALVVLAIGLMRRPATVVAGVSPSNPATFGAARAGRTTSCLFIAVLGLAAAIGAVLLLPRNASLS